MIVTWLSQYIVYKRWFELATCSGFVYMPCALDVSVQV